METTKPSRRRTKKPKLENYYKILGLRANAAQGSIKQKYIAAVKAFPPETHPEEFQQIRRAYETLKDPIKRREYDLMRKYGGKLEKMVEDIWLYIERGSYSKAEALTNQLMEIVPEDHNIRLIMAQILLLQGDFLGFHEQFDMALQNAPVKERPMMMLVKARLLFEADKSEEALQVLEEARSAYPEDIHLFLNLYIDIYLDLERKDELWQFALSIVPAPGNETAQDIHIFIFWLNIMIEAEQWKDKSKIQQRLRKLLKSANNDEDKQIILEALQFEHDGYFEAGRFKEAEIFMDFLYYLDATNPEIQAQRKETQELMRVEKEIFKMERERLIFPLIGFYAVKWFYQDYWPAEEFESLEESLLFLNSEAGEDLQIDELFVRGLVDLRKKYPLLYRYYQDAWDKLYTERIQHLSRDVRRQLK